jgi:hypothetical protein
VESAGNKMQSFTKDTATVATNKPFASGNASGRVSIHITNVAAVFPMELEPVVA